MTSHSIPMHNMGENNFFVIETIENCDKLNFAGVHRHKFYEILYFTHVDKEDYHTIDFVKYPLFTNQLYILKPGQVHSLKLQHQKGFLFAVNPEYFNTIQLHTENYIDYTLPNTIIPDANDSQNILQIIRLIFNEFYHQHRKNLLNAYMNAFITYLISISQKDSDTEKIDKRVLVLLDIIDKYFLSEHSTNFYAQQVSLSNRRINDLTIKYLNVTVKQLIRQRLLLEAKRLISLGDMTFKEIAFHLGFSDASYFSRFFKEYSGITPEQFKLSIT